MVSQKEATKSLPAGLVLPGIKGQPGEEEDICPICLDTFVSSSRDGLGLGRPVVCHKPKMIHGSSHVVQSRGPQTIEVHHGGVHCMHMECLFKHLTFSIEQRQPPKCPVCMSDDILKHMMESCYYSLGVEAPDPEVLDVLKFVDAQQFQILARQYVEQHENHFLTASLVLGKLWENAAERPAWYYKMKSNASLLLLLLLLLVLASLLRYVLWHSLCQTFCWQLLLPSALFCGPQLPV